MRILSHRLLFLIALGTLTVLFLPLGLGQQRTKPYKVTIAEEKPDVAESFTPVDTKIRVAFSYGTKGREGIGMNYGVSAEGKQLADCVGTLFLIDDQIRSPQKTPSASYNVPHGSRSSSSSFRVVKLLSLTELTVLRPVSPRSAALHSI